MFLLIPSQLRLKVMRSDFNTSHVSINLIGVSKTSFKQSHFNTSHVSINPGTVATVLTCPYNFNTSHVSINLYSVLLFTFC